MIATVVFSFCIFRLVVGCSVIMRCSGAYQHEAMPLVRQPRQSKRCKVAIGRRATTTSRTGTIPEKKKRCGESGDEVEEGRRGVDGKGCGD